MRDVEGGGGISAEKSSNVTSGTAWATSAEATRATAVRTIKANLMAEPVHQREADVGGFGGGGSIVERTGGRGAETAVVGDLYTVTGPDSHLQFMDQTSNGAGVGVHERYHGGAATEAAAIAAETARALAAESNLSGLITAETNRATAAEGAEFTRATGAESALSTSIGNEVTRATGAEAAYLSDIDRSGDGGEDRGRDASTLSAAEAFSGK